VNPEMEAAGRQKALRLAEKLIVFCEKGSYPDDDALMTVSKQEEERKQITNLMKYYRLEQYPGLVSVFEGLGCCRTISRRE
jgi:hypothetical protein